MADPGALPASGPYRRVVLKLSGESFAHAGERGISMDEVVAIGGQVCKAAKSGVQIAIVIGGGNILRGAQFTAGNSSIQEATAHYMGMLATVINGLALQDAIESLGAGVTLFATTIEDPIEHTIDIVVTGLNELTPKGLGVVAIETKAFGANCLGYTLIARRFDVFVVG